MPPRRAVLVISSVAVLGLLAPPALAAGWSTVPVAAVGRQSALGGVDLLTGSDGWAVGGAIDTGGLIERWNGTAWSVVASPDILDHRSPNNSAGLSAVDALSATSAFAVGGTSSYSYDDGLQHRLPVVEHWNGTAWTRQSVPQPNYATDLAAVKAFSGTDVWALGRTGGQTGGQTFALHYNGTGWTQVATPSPGTKDNILTAVAGAAPNDLWAFGYTKELPYGNRARKTIALHWNGSAWSSVSLPDLGAVQTFLYGAVAISTSDLWVTGYASGSTGIVPVAYHWNGSAWSLHSTPALQTLSEVTALSATDVWVSGTDTQGVPYLANWNGSAWSLTPVPTTGNLSYTSITGMAAVSPGAVHAIGVTSDPITTGDSRPIALRTANG